VLKYILSGIAAVALHHERAHMRISDMSGLADVSLPTLGVSSLDLGRTDFRAAPSLCRTTSQVAALRQRASLDAARGARLHTDM
jgi:hypothetical protein